MAIGSEGKNVCLTTLFYDTVGVLSGLWTLVGFGVDGTGWNRMGLGFGMRDEVLAMWVVLPWQNVAKLNGFFGAMFCLIVV